MRVTTLFKDFFNSEKSAGLVLIVCTVISLFIANSAIGTDYIHFWHSDLQGRPVDFWVNDVLMTVFFLLVGLEIEREVYIGELHGIKKAMLPLLAAFGGMAVPALIHFMFNHGTPTQHGFGIPMATDIAFSLGVLSLLGNRVSTSIKVFLTALAIIDDLGAILVIALFYSNGLLLIWIGIGALLFAVMLIMNRMKMYIIWIYFVFGAGLWYCLHRAGIHPSIAGVLLAFAIPFGTGSRKSPSYNLQKQLHGIVAFLILPLFALANTAIHIPDDFSTALTSHNSLGIMAGLSLGKPIGIFLFSVVGAALGLCTIPKDIKRTHLFGIGILAGIGFTMSIFITLLAFNSEETMDSSKIAIIIASVLSGIIGLIWLRLTLPNRTMHLKKL